MEGDEVSPHHYNCGMEGSEVSPHHYNCGMEGDEVSPHHYNCGMEGDEVSPHHYNCGVEGREVSPHHYNCLNGLVVKCYPRLPHTLSPFLSSELHHGSSRGRDDAETRHRLDNL